jgi:SHS2 domain-containing protein
MDLIQADHKAIASVTVSKADPTRAAAAVCCEPLDPARHEILTEVKAVTYHQLQFRQEGARWVGRVVLDL